MLHALACFFPLLAAASDSPEPAPSTPAAASAPTAPPEGSVAPPVESPDAAPGAHPSNLPVAGAALRTMLREVGFAEVQGEHTTHPGAPTNPSIEHRDQPPAGGSAEPGFLLQFRVQQMGPAPIRVEVGGVLFRPNDAGQPPDAVGGDGLWSTMIERYPGDAPVVVFQGEAELARAEIHLRETDDVPVMVLDIP